MKTLRQVEDLRAVVADWRRAGEKVGVVPTMGALHDGHLSLVRAAKSATNRVIVTIFVNPAQFNNPEDLKKYPRTEERDAAMLRAAGVDCLFAPAPEVVYPEGFATSVSVGKLTDGYCGSTRPGHFDGVATVVTKLFLMTGADRAFFGEKDWQQLQIVRRLAADLNIPVAITGCPTLREQDGLAMSSRNTRLSDNARKTAPALYRAMTEAGAAVLRGMPVSDAMAAARKAIGAVGFGPIDYLDLCDAETLEPLTMRPERPARLLAAAWLGEVRLIDNIPVVPAE